jgi:hypothetical protein
MRRESGSSNSENFLCTKNVVAMGEACAHTNHTSSCLRAENPCCRRSTMYSLAMMHGVPSPAYVPPDRRELRRKVALAYRDGMTTGMSHHSSWERAFSVYADAEPEKAADRIAASYEVNIMIASAINADPKWFWRPVRERMERGEIRRCQAACSRRPRPPTWHAPFRRGTLPNLRRYYNAAPTQSLALVLLAPDARERRLEALHWGWSHSGRRTRPESCLAIASPRRQRATPTSLTIR